MFIIEHFQVFPILNQIGFFNVTGSATHKDTNVPWTSKAKGTKQKMQEEEERDILFQILSLDN